MTKFGARNPVVLILTLIFSMVSSGCLRLSSLKKLSNRSSSTSTSASTSEKVPPASPRIPPPRTEDPPRDPGDPEPPRAYVDSELHSSPSGSRVFTPADGAAFQKALDESRPGDQILLQAGVEYTLGAGSDGFRLRNKACSAANADDCYIQIRTSNLQGIPAAGTRVDPALHASAMPKIVAKNASAAISAELGAHHYRFIGVEFAMDSSYVVNGLQFSYGLVRIGESRQTMTQMSQQPHHIIFDRVYAHGKLASHVKRAFELNGSHLAVVDSYLSEIHGVGQDTQAIVAWNGSGPFKITNNYLEAAGENILIGGADPAVPEMIPSDIEVRRNRFYKPISWLTTIATHDENGQPNYWTVKNIFEIKDGQRVVLQGNLLENNWVKSQVGFAILFQNVSDEQSARFVRVQDVLVKDNWIKSSPGGVNISARPGSYRADNPAQRIRVENNLFEKVGSDPVLGQNGRMFQLLGDLQDVRIIHNTVIAAQGTVTVTLSLENEPGTASGMVFRDNLSPLGTYGVTASGISVGTPSLLNFDPGFKFTHNALVDWEALGASRFPVNNIVLRSYADVGLVDANAANYRLRSSSPLKGTASDNSNIGADQDVIRAAIGF